MSNLTPLVTLVALEVAAILLAVLAVQWFLRHRHQRRELAAVQRLVSDLREGGEARQTALQSFLQEQLGVEPEASPELAEGLAQQEDAFYRYLVRTYLGRDHEALGRLQQNMMAVLSRYQTLLGEQVAGRKEMEAAFAERDQLREENAELSRARELLAAEKAQKEEQLSITLNTVNQMLDEYSHLFAGSELPTKRLPRDSVLERVLTSIEVEEAKESGAAPQGGGSA